MRPGCYDVAARVKDMNQDGVLASLCFPSFPRVCGQTFYEARDRELKPSRLFRERVFGCFIDDVHGLDHLDAMGVDNVLIEVDCPHTDTSWPNSIATAHKRLVKRSDEDIYKILQGNVRRLFDFTPAEIPAVPGE